MASGILLAHPGMETPLPAVVALSQPLERQRSSEKTDFYLVFILCLERMLLVLYSDGALVSQLL